jgi:glyoxylase-like metal-dependent hydrolase (beta-lactamase superfamily II)
MHELLPGLTTWTAPHPSWTPEEGGPEGWDQDVRSYTYDAGNALILFDPLDAPPEIYGLADARPVIVLLTCHWHQRSSEELAERLGAAVFSPQAKIDDVRAPAQPYRHGDTLPGGVEALVGGYPDEATLWIPACGGLVIGDVFLGGEQGFRVQPDSWLADGLTHEGLRERLRPLLELPVELLLPTHGEPVVEDARGVLERALAT